MISKYRHKELVWVDLESPTEEEVAYITEEYTIPPFIKENIARNSQEDIINLDNSFTFAYLNLPRVLTSKKENNRLIFIANDSFIIVIHDEPIQALGEFSKEMELDTITGERFKNNSKLMFAYLLKDLYINSQKQLVAEDTKIKIFRKQILQKSKILKSFIWLFIVSLIVIILVICL